MASKVSSTSSSNAVERTRTVTGHLGHLTPAEETALAEFKKLSADQRLYTPPGPGPDSTQKASHDDGTLLRFLRARKFVVHDAFKQFSDTEAWRNVNQLDSLYDNIEVSEFQETRSLYPQWTGRRDRRGVPVYLYEVRHLNSKTMAAYEQNLKKSTKAAGQGAKDGQTAPPKLLRLFALYEHLICFVMPLCTAIPNRPNPETPVTQSCNIVDISGVGLRQFWNLRSHMQDASTLATAHYPETLDRIFIIGAPSFFPTVWSWIKSWFDPITVSKIFILSAHDVKPTLAELIHPADIPKKYGGELDFEFGDPPSIDPVVEQLLTWSSPPPESGLRLLPDGPIRWIEQPNKDKEALALGSVDGKLRREAVAVIHSPDQEGVQTASEPLVPEEKRMETEGLESRGNGQSIDREKVEAPLIHDMPNSKDNICPQQSLG